MVDTHVPAEPGPSERGSSEQGLRVVFFNRRDVSNPEGGGSELYVEIIARTMASAGHEITVYSADHGLAPPDETVAGVRYVRRGGKLSVLARAWWDLRRGALGRFDVVVDVQNGVPFFSTLATRRPVVALVHHVHREMWPVVYGARAASLGWWVESRLAPWLYRHSPYVAVSESTCAELVDLGVPAEQIQVIHNGVNPLIESRVPRSPSPALIVLGRLVPHKQVSHALHAIKELRDEFPDLQLRVVGDGWWAPELHLEAEQLGIDGIVTFTGFVDEQEKADELARAWCLVIPSLKEGWGLVVIEAASHGVPSVGYRTARGVAESIVDGETGFVVDGGPSELTMAIRRVITDPDLRDRLAAACEERARAFSWATTVTAFEGVLREAVTSGDSRTTEAPNPRQQLRTNGQPPAHVTLRSR